MAVQFHCASCGRQFRVKEQFRATLLKCPGCKAEAIADGPHVRGYDAFVSYSSKDQQIADAIVAALESKGVRCWIAPRDIDAGAPWGAAIIEAIEDSRLMVLVFSAHANTSDQVLREVERAVAKKVPIIPLRIDDVVMSKSLEYFLGASHWLTATDGGIERHLSQLTSTVRQMLLVRAVGSADGSSSNRSDRGTGHAVVASTDSRAPFQFRGLFARTIRKPVAVLLLLLLFVVTIAIGIVIRVLPARKPAISSKLSPELVTPVSTTRSAGGADSMPPAVEKPSMVAADGIRAASSGPVRVPQANASAREVTAAKAPPEVADTSPAMLFPIGSVWLPVENPVRRDESISLTVLSVDGSKVEFKYQAGTGATRRWTFEMTQHGHLTQTGDEPIRVPKSALPITDVQVEGTVTSTNLILKGHRRRGDADANVDMDLKRQP